MEDIDRLMDQLKPEKLPVFNKTVQEVLEVTRSSVGSGADLTRVILNDPSMTANILHVANRIPYNPSINAIATVSQAVLLLGFETISRLTLTKAFIDTLLKGNAQQYLLDLISVSLHAAVQAHALARRRKDTSPEDVFIATLLKRIGDIALWCVSPEASGRVAELMAEKGLSMHAAQKAVFGCTGEQLTVRLSHEWSLGSLLEDAVAENGRDPRLQIIDAGEQLATSVAAGDEAALAAQLPALKKLLGTDSDDVVREFVDEGTEEALVMARHYGLPTGPISELLNGDEEEDAEPVAPVEWMEPDHNVQLHILGEISRLLDGQPNINLLLEMVAEGIYRGIGMDTVFFALMTRDRTGVSVRYVLSQDDQAIEAKRSMRLQKDHCVVECLRSGQPMWYPDASSGIPDPVLKEQCRGGEFFLQAIRVGKVPIGVFYADRAASKRGLDNTAFESFRQFCQQANLGLAFMKTG